MIPAVVETAIPAVSSTLWRDSDASVASERQDSRSMRQEESAVKVSLSQSARSLVSYNDGNQLPVNSLNTYENLKKDQRGKSDSNQNGSGSGADSQNSGQNSEKSSTGKTLSKDDEKTLEEMKKRDREVRTHETQHLTAAGPYAKGGIKYDYETGPDNKQYAVGGSVNIDTSPVPNDPDATMTKARMIKASATAVSEPSPEDNAVASAAINLESQANVEKAKDEEDEKMQKTDKTEKSSKKASMLKSYNGGAGDSFKGKLLQISA